MAYETIWIAMATMISIYDIKKAVGPDGKPINLSRETSTSLVSCVSIVLLLSAPR